MIVFDDVKLKTSYPGNIPPKALVGYFQFCFYIIIDPVQFFRSQREAL